MPAEMCTLEEEYALFPCEFYTSTALKKKHKPPAHASAHGHALKLDQEFVEHIQEWEAATPPIRFIEDLSFKARVAVRPVILSNMQKAQESHKRDSVQSVSKKTHSEEMTEKSPQWKRRPKCLQKSPESSENGCTFSESRYAPAVRDANP